MTTNDRDVQVSRVLLASNLSDKGLGTDNIEGGDTEEPLGVEYTSLLEDLGGDGNGRVDRVGDDKHECFWAVLGNALDETLHDTGVDLEEGLLKTVLLGQEACNSLSSFSISVYMRG